jgi:hypothetical protein
MLDGLKSWLDQVLQSFGSIDDGLAMPIAIGFLLFLGTFAMTLIFRRRQASQGQGCARCQGGYEVYGLRLAGYDGRQMGVYCPECQAFYSVETSGSRVQRIDAGFVREHWPSSPYARAKRAGGAPSATP